MVPDQKYYTIYTSNDFLNHAFAENFSCLSQKLVNPLFYPSRYFLLHIPFYALFCTLQKRMCNCTCQILMGLQKVGEMSTANTLQFI